MRSRFPPRGPQFKRSIRYLSVSAGQLARQYWLARGRSNKHKVIALQRAYHGATLGTLEVCGIPALFTS